MNELEKKCAEYIAWVWDMNSLCEMGMPGLYGLDSRREEMHEKICELLGIDNGHERTKDVLSRLDKYIGLDFTTELSESKSRSLGIELAKKNKKILERRAKQMKKEIAQEAQILTEYRIVKNKNEWYWVESRTRFPHCVKDKTRDPKQYSWTNWGKRSIGCRKLCVAKKILETILEEDKEEIEYNNLNNIGICAKVGLDTTGNITTYCVYEEN